MTNGVRRRSTDIRNKVAPKRNEATFLFDHLYRAVAPKVVIRDVRPVAPDVSQELVRVPVSTFPVRSMVGGRLQDVDVRKTGMIVTDAGHNLRKCGNRIWHPHAWQFYDDTIRILQSKSREEPTPNRQTDSLTLVRQPRTEPYAHLFRADRPRDRTSDLEHEPRAVPHRAAVLIRPRVGIRLHKLVREEPVRSVDLDAVEPSAEDGILCCGRIQPHVFPDFLYRQRAGNWRWW